MVLNFIDLSNNIKTNYQGQFNDIGTTIEAYRTNATPEMLDTTKSIMDNRQFIENLKTLLSSEFNNDVELFAKAIGIQADQIYHFLNGMGNPPHGLVDKMEKYNSAKEDNYFQFGNRIEINNSGDGYEQSYADILSDDKKEYTKRLKSENFNLRKLLREKDELISALRETIELLKNK